MRVLSPFLISVLGMLLAPPGWSIEPFEARFAVSRNGSEAGTMQMRLSETEAGRFEFHSATRARGGMAGFLGASIDEHSQLRHDGQAWETLAYRYQQDLGVRKRRRSLERGVDGSWREVDGRRQWQYRAEGPLLDRHAVILAIADALREDASEGRVLAFQVADKGEVETWRFRVGPPETLKTGLGPIEAVRVERLREHARRQTISWHAADYAWLPVQAEQKESDGESILSVLNGYQGAGR